MNISKILLIIVLLFTCSRVNSLDFNPYEMIKNAVKKHLNDFLENNNATDANKMHLKFIQQFIRCIIFGEIKLYNQAIKQNDKTKAEQEVNGFIEILFQNKYKSLMQLVDEIKKEDDTVLKGLFTDKTFNDDIEITSNQNILVNSILQKLFTGESTEENLAQSFQYLEQIKKFLVKYKGVKENDIQRSIEYLKDVKQIQNSLDHFIDRLKEPSMRNKLFTIVGKLGTMKQNDNLFDIITSEPTLIKPLLDSNWVQLLNIKDSIYSIDAKSDKDYKEISKDQNKEQDKEEVKDDDDDDQENFDQQKQSSLTFGKVILIIACISFVIGLVFVGMRKYRQVKFGHDSFSEKKQLKKQSLNQSLNYQNKHI